MKGGKEAKHLKKEKQGNGNRCHKENVRKTAKPSFQLEFISPRSTHTHTHTPTHRQESWLSLGSALNKASFLLSSSLSLLLFSVLPLPCRAFPPPPTLPPSCYSFRASSPHALSLRVCFVSSTRRRGEEKTRRSVRTDDKTASLSLSLRVAVDTRTATYAYTASTRESVLSFGLFLFC